MLPDRIETAQQAVLGGWFPGGVEVVADLSWGLVDTVVLHVVTDVGDVVVKAGGPGDRHLVREVTGYLESAAVWADRDLSPRLLHHDRAARILAVTHLSGVLAAGTPAAHDPEVHRQAGAALARLHAASSRISSDFEPRQHQRCRDLLDSPHQVPADQLDRLRALLDAQLPGPTTVVPTHGDYSPRNWMVDADGRVRIIDLGRFDHRPASSDLCRLHHREWRGRPHLATAFTRGYGADLRDDAVWESQVLREALGTVTWAPSVGDRAFEQEGLRMVDDLVGPTTAWHGVAPRDRPQRA